MNYLKFLTTLLSLGDKMPVFIGAVKKIWDDLAALLALVQSWGIVPSVPAAGDLQMVNVSSEEEKLEGQIIERMSADASQPQAVFGDGTFLRKIFAFAKKIPGLLNVLMGLLGSLPTPTP